MHQTLGSHSAVVDMWLDCGPHGTIPLARITPRSVVAKVPRPVPPGEARLVVTIDGERLCRRVMLNAGFARGRRAALIRPINEGDGVAPF